MSACRIVRLPGLCAGLLLLFAATCVAPAAPATSENDRAREAWMVGYLKFEEAVKAENGNNQVLALDLYREALTTFNQVKAKFPNWSPSLLDYRINFCKEHCRRLEALVTARNVDLSKPELVTLSRNQQEQIKARSQEIADTRKKLDVSTQALERARGEAARNLTADTEMIKLLQENKNLQESVRAATERENQLRRELEGLKSETGLKAKADTLQQKLDATLARQAELEQTAGSQKSALRNALDQLKSSTLQRERLAAELEELKKSAGGEKERTAQMAGQLQTLDKQVKALQKENAGLAATRAEQVRLATEAAGQLRTAATDRRRLEQALIAAKKDAGELQKTLDARQIQLRTLEATLANLQKTPGTGDKTTTPEELAARVTALEEELADARGKLAKAESSLQDSQDFTRKIESKAEVATRDLVARQAALAKATDQLAELTREREDQNKMLDTLQQRNGELAAQLAALKKEARVEGGTAAAGATLAAAQERGDRLEKNLTELANRHKESQQLARRQEEKIGELEKAVAEKSSLAREQEKKIAELDAALLPVKDLTTALAGLKSSLSEARAATTTAEARLHRIEKENSTLETRFEEKDKELAGLRTELLNQKLEKAPQNDPLRETVKGLARDLDREREKVKALDQTMAAQQLQMDQFKEKFAVKTAAAAEEAPGVRQQLAMLETKLKQQETEAASLRQQLAKERVDRAPENDPLLDELRNLNRDLDREREKVKKMEKALAEQAAGGRSGVTPAAGTKETGSVADRANMAIGFLQMAATAEKQGKPETAVWNYKKALEYEPDNKLAVKRLGLLAAQTGNDDEGEGYLRRAFYADPDDVDVLLPLGFALVRQGKVDLALSMLARAAALRPQDSAVHRAYGVACSSLGWGDAAEAQFRRSLEMNDKDGEAAFNLSVLLAARKPPRMDEARTWYLRAKELGVPPDPGLDKVFGE